MLASLRAELLVLRKWRAVWALLAVTPLLTLAASYLVPYVQYLTVTPAEYGTLGPPAQQLPVILPGQFVIVAISHFGFAGGASLIVLGAVMAGGDWGRGTIKTALLQAPSRTRTFTGQAVAMVIACAVSVAATFAVAAVASIVIALAETGSVSPVAGPMPSAAVVARGLAVGLLVSVVYGAAGIALGTLFRNAGLAIAAGLLWTVVVEANVYDLGSQIGGTFGLIVDILPSASIASITSLFGALGGGPDTSMYFPVRPALGAGVLVAYTAAFLAFALVLLRRRDVGARGARRRTRSPAGQRSPVPPDPSRYAGLAVPGEARTGGVLTSLRAELLVLRKRPAVWAFVLLPAVYTLLSSYVSLYVYYRTASTGLVQGFTPAQFLPAILPGQFMMVSLNSLGGEGLGAVGGTVAFVLIGALIAGSGWDEGTIKTALLQGPGRVQSLVGQALAVVLALAASVVATVATAGAASTVIAVTQTGSVSPAASPFPSPAHLASGLAAAFLVSLAYGAAGWTLGAVFRSAAGAIAAALLWAVILQPTLDSLAAQFHGILQAIYNLLPDASTTTVSNLLGAATSPLVPAPAALQIAPAAALLVLIAYAAAFFACPALLIRRRDIA